MAEHYDLIIRGATCVFHAGVSQSDIGVVDGRTAAMGDLAHATGDLEIDATGLHLLPGVIDSQVHFREPGGEDKEDFESGSRAAALGGVTAVFEMPNTSPPTTTAEALGNKIDLASGRMWCDFAFYVGATADNASQLHELERLPGCCGVKIFMGSSTGDLLVADDETLRQVLTNTRRRVAVHAEDEKRLVERKFIGRKKVSNHPMWRDAETAFIATERIVGLAREAGRRVHILHVSTAKEISFLSLNRDIATVEVTPQHLTLAAPDCYHNLGARAQMNPPIRSAEHRAVLWRGVILGVVDVIGSDHAPHSLEEKDAPYPRSPSGMPGIQTLLPLMLDHVAQNRLSLLQLVDLTSAGAARIFGIAGKGRLAVGNDADYTLVDLKAERTIENSWIASKCGWTPFDGQKVTGWPVGTIVRGSRVMWEGELSDAAPGRPMRFLETL
ncbi:MAG: dihydroorotase [Sphingomonadales bacterium]